MLLRAIILHCQLQFQQRRSISATFHLLKGKQSIQTIQDAHLFKLEQYYAIYKSLTENLYTETITRLTREKQLVKINENEFLVTKIGTEFLAEQSLHQFAWQGMKYRQIDSSFNNRLLLLIQVLTNSQSKNNKYVPIVDDEKSSRWIKFYYRQQKQNILGVLKQLYDELIQILSCLPSIYPQLFIHQISTANKIGLTDVQIAKKIQVEAFDIPLMTKHLLHFMIQTVEIEKRQYPVLSSLLDDQAQSTTMLTKTAQQTFYYLQEGNTLEQIAHRRKLKLNTIYDHVVEIALHIKDFSIDSYVSYEQQKEINEAITQTKLLKLKEIKQMVHKEISYFQIRLVLAKSKQEEGENNGN